MNDTMKYYIKHAGTLLIITVCVGLLLAGVNQITAPIIDAQAQAARAEALSVVMPEADEFTDTSYEGADPLVLSLFEAYQGGALIGWCVEVAPTGYASTPMNLIVAIDTTGTVTALQVVSHGETPGIGTKAVESEAWLTQFVGQTGSASVDAVSGATRSSKAVIAGVNAALTALAGAVEGGAI